jgi:ferric-dicitrate binding protein FerR (iron transport regulator)
MKNQDKIELLLDIQEHPEKYSDEQLNSMLAEDEELAEMMEQLATTKRAMTKEEAEDEQLDMDVLWQEFEAEHELEFDEPETKRVSMPLRKIAAMFIGVALTAGVAFAAIQIVRSVSKPAPEPTKIEAPAAPKAAQPDDEVPADTVVAVKPVVFDNVELAQIMEQIAAHYKAEVEIENEDAGAYRLYFEWNSQETLEHVVERLNRFESINIELNNNKMTVK